MTMLEKLNALRSAGGAARTVGLADDIITRFAAQDEQLGRAVDEAYDSFLALSKEYPALLEMDEVAQAEAIQAGYVNFYHQDCVNPYVSLAARGPWVITLKGAVIHDNGGYGMLGFGHGPEAILGAMNGNQVMANVMTPNISQLRLDHALRRELGQRRADGCPFHSFVCMNSGSESVTVAGRIGDILARQMTDEGGRYAGRPIRRIAMSGGFHGRTDRPARISDSSRATYEKYLASFREHNDLWTAIPNDVASLEALFERAEREGVFIEMVSMEPVMGEGNPGAAITPEFYAAARRLTSEHGALLLIDSIQAGLRAHGCLSIVDYPGFEGLEAPDMETYSKALNAGQYPLSVLALSERAAGIYKRGVYGNTMTTNPRSMDVAVAVLDATTDALRENIRNMGKEFVAKLEGLASELNGPITMVQGTGLLFSCELAPEFKCYGENSTEEYMRMHGIGVIHGGENSLRFTPHFAVNSAEVDLVVDAVRDALLNGPRRSEQDRHAA